MTAGDAERSLAALFELKPSGELAIDHADHAARVDAECERAFAFNRAGNQQPAGREVDRHPVGPSGNRSRDDARQRQH
jgi:hypothetical protein